MVWMASGESLDGYPVISQTSGKPIKADCETEGTAQGNDRS